MNNNKLTTVFAVLHSWCLNTYKLKEEMIVLQLVELVPGKDSRTQGNDRAKREIKGSGE